VAIQQSGQANQAAQEQAERARLGSRRIRRCLAQRNVIDIDIAVLAVALYRKEVAVGVLGGHAATCHGEGEHLPPIIRVARRLVAHLVNELAPELHGKELQVATLVVIGGCVQPEG
jgi:hypothetical protein